MEKNRTLLAADRTDLRDAPRLWIDAFDLLIEAAEPRLASKERARTWGTGVVRGVAKNYYLSGAPDNRWDNSDLHNLGQVTASDFEVVQMNPIYTSSNVPQGPAPSISSFTASAMTVSAGTQVTLSWQASGAS